MSALSPLWLAALEAALRELKMPADRQVTEKERLNCVLDLVTLFAEAEACACAAGPGALVVRVERTRAGAIRGVRVETFDGGCRSPTMWVAQA